MTRTGTGSGSETETSTAATSADREKEKRMSRPGSVEAFGSRLWRSVEDRLEGAKRDQSPSG